MGGWGKVYQKNGKCVAKDFGVILNSDVDDDDGDGDGDRRKRKIENTLEIKSMMMMMMMMAMEMMIGGRGGLITRWS